MTTPPIMTINDELLAELEAAALNSSGGKWELDGPGQVISAEYFSDGEPMHDHIASFACGASDPDDASLVAKANPATILALLQHVRELKIKADRYDWLAKEHNDGYGGIWVSTWDSDAVAWVSLDASWLPEFCGELDLDAAVDAARSSAD